MHFLNSVIWEPEAAGVERVFFNNNPTNLNVNDYLVEHSMIHLSSCVYNGVDPCQENMIYGVWPNFVDSTGQLGLVPWGLNPGLNKGSNLVADTFGLTKDFDGVDRVYCDTVDIGAYEIHALCTSGTLDRRGFVNTSQIRILENPVTPGSDIRAELMPGATGRFYTRLWDIQGHLIRQEQVAVSAFIPQVMTLPGNGLLPGLYFLQVMDEKGWSQTEKIVVL